MESIDIFDNFIEDRILVEIISIGIGFGSGIGGGDHAKFFVGWGDREGCGGGRVGVYELSGCCTSGVEVDEVIKNEFQVGSHGLVIQVVEVLQIFYVILLDSGFERGGEEQD